MSIAQECSVYKCTSKKYTNKQGMDRLINGFCIKHNSRYIRNNHTDRLIESHNMSRTVEYRIWSSMKDRCTNPESKFYYRYGGRGINVYEPWIKSFKDFYRYIGPRPSKSHSIDRIDNDGNYEPGNVRWATIDVQALNKSVRSIARDIEPLNLKNIPSGKIKGVCYSNSSRKWRAYMNKDGIRYDATFKTKLEAYNYRKAFENL